MITLRIRGFLASLKRSDDSSHRGLLPSLPGLYASLHTLPSYTPPGTPSLLHLPCYTRLLPAGLCYVCCSVGLASVRWRQPGL